MPAGDDPGVAIVLDQRRDRALDAGRALIAERCGGLHLRVSSLLIPDWAPRPSRASACAEPRPRPLGRTAPASRRRSPATAAGWPRAPVARTGTVPRRRLTRRTG